MKIIIYIVALVLILAFAAKTEISFIPLTIKIVNYKTLLGIVLIGIGYTFCYKDAYSTGVNDTIKALKEHVSKRDIDEKYVHDVLRLKANELKRNEKQKGTPRA